jgi:hypothetical protein
MAFATLLFFPQVCAVSGHLWHGTTETLPHYRVHIPWSWWVNHRSSDFGDNQYIGVLTGKNIVQAGIKPYLSGQIIRSSVTFSIFNDGPDERRLKQKAQQDGKDVASHDFEVGKLHLTCWEYVPESRWWEDWETRSRWEVDCSTMPTGGATDLFVSFKGPKEDIPAFYKALVRIERTD